MRRYSASNLNALWFLIAACVLVFIATLVIGEAIFFYFGLIPALLLDHPWTIITNLFVHGGLWHLLFNMISLYFLGSFLLRLVGERSFLGVFFLGGIVGNIFYILLGPQNIPGVGASGAVFAIGGALMMIAPKLRVFIFPIPAPVPLWVAILIFFFLSFLPGIAWQAHLGGLLLGLIAGYYFRRRRRIYYF
jgi:membrane associated rhomboid family serine protease